MSLSEQIITIINQAQKDKRVKGLTPKSRGQVASCQAVYDSWQNGQLAKAFGFDHLVKQHCPKDINDLYKKANPKAVRQTEQYWLKGFAQIKRCADLMALVCNHPLYKIHTKKFGAPQLEFARINNMLDVRIRWKDKSCVELKLHYSCLQNNEGEPTSAVMYANPLTSTYLAYKNSNAIVIDERFFNTRKKGLLEQSGQVYTYKKSYSVSEKKLVFNANTVTEKLKLKISKFQNNSYQIQTNNRVSFSFNGHDGYRHTWIDSDGILEVDGLIDFCHVQMSSLVKLYGKQGLYPTHIEYEIPQSVSFDYQQIINSKKGFAISVDDKGNGARELKKDREVLYKSSHYVGCAALGTQLKYVDNKEDPIRYGLILDLLVLSILENPISLMQYYDDLTPKERQSIPLSKALLNQAYDQLIGRLVSAQEKVIKKNLIYINNQKTVYRRDRLPLYQLFNNLSNEQLESLLKLGLYTQPLLKTFALGVQSVGVSMLGNPSDEWIMRVLQVIKQALVPDDQLTIGWDKLSFKALGEYKKTLTDAQWDAWIKSANDFVPAKSGQSESLNIDFINDWLTDLINFVQHALSQHAGMSMPTRGSDFYSNYFFTIKQRSILESCNRVIQEKKLDISNEKVMAHLIQTEVPKASNGLVQLDFSRSFKEDQKVRIPRLEFGAINAPKLINDLLKVFFTGNDVSYDLPILRQLESMNTNIHWMINKQTFIHANKYEYTQYEIETNVFDNQKLGAGYQEDLLKIQLEPLEKLYDYDCETEISWQQLFKKLNGIKQKIKQMGYQNQADKGVVFVSVSTSTEIKKPNQNVQLDLDINTKYVNKKVLTLEKWGSYGFLSDITTRREMKFLMLDPQTNLPLVKVFTQSNPYPLKLDNYTRAHNINHLYGQWCIPLEKISALKKQRPIKPINKKLWERKQKQCTPFDVPCALQFDIYDWAMLKEDINRLRVEDIEDFQQANEDDFGPLANYLLNQGSWGPMVAYFNKNLIAKEPQLVHELTVLLEDCFNHKFIKIKQYQQGTDALKKQLMDYLTLQDIANQQSARPTVNWSL